MESSRTGEKTVGSQTSKVERRKGLSNGRAPVPGRDPTGQFWAVGIGQLRQKWNRLVAFPSPGNGHRWMAPDRLSWPGGADKARKVAVFLQTTPRHEVRGRRRGANKPKGVSWASLGRRTGSCDSRLARAMVL